MAVHVVIILKVRNQLNQVQLFAINRRKPLRKLMEVYCARLSISVHSARFRFGGQLINATDTADSLQMQEGDTIDMHMHAVQVLMPMWM